MTKVWYFVQIFPPPDDCVRKSKTSISWFVWKGDIFRVPLSTLQRRKEEGGWDLINLQAKSLALFLYRMRIQDQRKGTLSAEWTRKWKLTEQSTSLPSREMTPAALGYLRRLEIESAYVALQGHTESQSAYKRRIYATMHSIQRETSGNREMRITKLWPQANWKVVWKNLRETPVPESSRAAWYSVIHYIIPKNDRLHRIGLTPTDSCRICGKKDTLEHRIIDCGEGEKMWIWTKQGLAQMLRTVPGRIPDGWLTCPQFTLWPPQPNRTVLWLMANIITFHTQEQRDLTLQDYIDFLKRTR